MSTYASLKGRSAEKAVSAPTRKAPSALRDDDAARVEANRKFVREHMPEFIPTIRALYEAGLIDGWRAVTKCKLNERTQ